MKVEWRKVLSDWKATPEGMGSSVLLKQYFPQLLKRVLVNLEPNFKANLESDLKNVEFIRVMFSLCFKE